MSQVSTSASHFRTSFEQACASGKLDLARLAGIVGGFGQSTAVGVGLLAHPVNIDREIVDARKSGITLFPRFNQRSILDLFFLTILRSQRFCASGIVRPQLGNVLTV